MKAPSAVIVGATDRKTTVTFLERFGFVEAASSKMDADTARQLYGLDAGTSMSLLLTPGARGGHIQVVETPHVALPRTIFDHGPLALDLYTTDFDADLVELSAAGITLGTPGTLELGPLMMRQVQVTAPDGWRIVLVEANHRRPSRLDDSLFKARHSEVHSQLWTVPNLAAAAAEWIKAGFVQSHVFPIAHPELAKIMDLPTPETGLKMNLLIGDHEDPIRVELVEFPGNPGQPEPTDNLLRAGVHGLWLNVPDLDGPVASRVTGARRVTVKKKGSAIVGRLGGVRVECWATPS